MLDKITDSTSSDILGHRQIQDVDTAAGWLSRLGYFSLFAGAASLFAANPHEVWAREVNAAAVSPRIAKKAKIVAGMNACSKPELLRRQSEYRLPHQKSSFDMMAVLAGSDNCPGLPIPAGTYTAAAPYTDTGNTTGANNTVSSQGCF